MKKSKISKSKTLKSQNSKSKISKRKNFPLAYNKVDEALIKLNNEYVILRNFNEAANKKSNKSVISGSTLMAGVF